MVVVECEIILFILAITKQTDRPLTNAMLAWYRVFGSLMWMDNPPDGFITRVTVEQFTGVGPWTGRVV